MLNKVELNMVLYYADFLSLRRLSIPVTDNCKYYYIHGTPINSAYLVGLEPFYDTENPYYLLAYMELSTLKLTLTEEEVCSFVEDICNLRALGCINAVDMLRCIHRYDSKSEKKFAMKLYDRWRRSQTYTHIVLDDAGDEIEQQCTQYVAHYEHAKYPLKRIRYIERVSIVPEVPRCGEADDTTTEQID